MLAAFRIVKARHAVTAFDGEGARRDGGRWNSPGLAVVYTAGSAALAALEILAHIGTATLLPAYMLIGCTFDKKIVLRLDRKRLPRDWRAYPARPELQLLATPGSRTARRRCSRCRTRSSPASRTSCSTRCTRISERSPSAR